MLGKVSKLKKFLVASVCALLCFTSVDISDAFATPSWTNSYVYYYVTRRGYHNTANKKHKQAHKYSRVLYAKTRRDATCIRDGYYQYKCVYAGCRAYTWERTKKGAPHRLYGDMRIVKQGNCKVVTIYKMKCRDCRRWIPEKIEGDHVYVTKNGRRVCKYCGIEDNTFTDGSR